MALRSVAQEAGGGGKPCEGGEKRTQKCTMSACLTGKYLICFVFIFSLLYKNLRLSKGSLRQRQLDCNFGFVRRP